MEKRDALRFVSTQSTRRKVALDERHQRNRASTLRAISSHHALPTGMEIYIFLAHVLSLKERPATTRMRAIVRTDYERHDVIPVGQNLCFLN